MAKLNKTQIKILESLRKNDSVSFNRRSESRFYTQAMNLVFDGILEHRSNGVLARSSTRFSLSDDINLNELLSENKN